MMTARFFKTSTALAGAAMGLAVVATPALAIDLPTVEGPIAEQFGNQMHEGLHYQGILPYLADPLPAPFNPETWGYVQEEYFISGTAGTLEEGGAAPYATRIVVLRPADVSDFNGMMTLETQHPGAGIFQTMSYSRVGGMQSGIMYVGVSNTNGQLGGGNHASGVNAARYEGLSIDGGGSAQNPIIAQVAALFKEANPIGDAWVPDFIVMTGASATAGTAINYMTSENGNTDPNNALADGSRPVDALAAWDNSGFNLGEDGGLDAGNLGGPLSGVPSIILATQSEFDGNYNIDDQNGKAPDSDTYRLFQVPGMAHIGSRYASDAYGCAMQPESRFMGGAYVFLLLDKMQAWVADGIDPGYGRVEFDDAGYVQDDHGNAVGGLRSPQVDVPTDTFMTPNSGGFICGLAGYSIPFDQATIDALYPHGQTSYANAMRASAQELIAAGSFPREYLWDVEAEIDAFNQIWVSPSNRY